MSLLKIIFLTRLKKNKSLFSFLRFCLYSLQGSASVNECCMFVCIPPRSSSGTRQLVGESLPSGWTHQPPAVCHLSDTHLAIIKNSIMYTCVCVWLYDGHQILVIHWCSLIRKPSRHSETVWYSEKEKGFLLYQKISEGVKHYSLYF